MLLRHVTRKQGNNYWWRAVIYTWISWWSIWSIWRKRRARNDKSPKNFWNPQARRDRSAILMLCLWMTLVCYQKHKACRNYVEEMPVEEKILVDRAHIVTWRKYRSIGIMDTWCFTHTHTTYTDRQQLNIWQMLARRWSHGHPYSWELRKQAYNAACRGNWWISSSVHISFTRLGWKKETTMDKWLQHISRRGEPRNLLPSFHVSQ